MCVCGCARIVTCWGHLWRWKQPLRNETKDTDILEKEDKEADKEEKGEVGKWRGSVMSASQDLESFSQCVFEGNGRSKLKWPSRQLMKCVVWPVEGKPNYDTSPGPWPLHEWWKTGGRKSRWQSLLPPDAARRMCAEIDHGAQDTPLRNFIPGSRIKQVEREKLVILDTHCPNYSFNPTITGFFSHQMRQYIF